MRYWTVRVDSESSSDNDNNLQRMAFSVPEWGKHEADGLGGIYRSEPTIRFFLFRNNDVKYRTYDEVFSLRNLYDAYKKCLIGVKWKGSVQNFSHFCVSGLYGIWKQLRERRAKTGHYHCFAIMERGKVRHIKSVSIDERIIQRCFCDNYLVPLLTRKFIYDNSACIKGKGMHFALRRLKRYLRKAYLRCGTNEFYILQFDFHHYFDTIDHELVIGMVQKEMLDQDLRNLYAQLVNDFGGHAGLGLGSQISQVSALFLPHRIDSLISSMKGVLGYARYMDDGYVIAKDKSILKRALDILGKMCLELKIVLNERKTMIKKASHSFEFLKARVFVTETGKIIMKPNRKNVTRNRRKLKRMFLFALEGKITFRYLENIFRTTYENLKHFNAFHTAKNYARLYAELIGALQK